MRYRLGVDLGTTYTAAATAHGASVTMVGLGDRALQVPSVVYLQEDGTFLCGEAAVRRAKAEPERAVREFKRRIGDTVPILVAGRPFSPEALSARMLFWVVAKAAERMGGPPDVVTLTHPANWGGYKRELLAQVAELANLSAFVACTEPEAAATWYATREHLRPGQRVAVYDLGGGTFDACVLEKQDVGFTVLGTPQGVEHLGGMDFDEAVFQHVVAQLGEAVVSLDQDDPFVMTGLAALRRECVEAKEALSSDVEASVPVMLPGLPASVRLTRVELEELVRPALEETLAATKRALRSADTSAHDLAAVVLVGGSSRIPLVSELVQRELGVRTAMDTHPKHDVALGSAVYQPGDRTGSSAGSSGLPMLAPAPADPTATEDAPPRARRRPRVLSARGRFVGALGALVLVAVAAVAGFLLLGDGAGEPGPESAGSRGAAVREVRCWRGTAATAAECPAPVGAAGIASVFPSFDPAGDCDGPRKDVLEGKAETVVCTSPDGYLVRYSRWRETTPARDRIAHYETDAPSEGQPWIVNGEEVGLMWFSYESPTTDPEETLRWQWSATYRDEPFSVSVEGRTESARDDGIDRVVARSPGEIGLAPE